MVPEPAREGRAVDPEGGALAGAVNPPERALVPGARVSVLIVSWGRGERLAQCLRAVRGALPAAEVLVLDNGSAPPLVPEAGCRWLRAAENLGYAAGNNRLFACATRPFILLLNNDAILPSAEPVRTLLAFLEAHPRVAAAQASLRLPDGTMDACGENLTPFGLLHHRGYRCPPGAVARQPAPVLAGKGACLLLRREAIAAAGGLFRPDFFCYYEDIDLGHRLWLAGFEVWYVPTEPVLHDEGSTARLLGARRIWRAYLSNMLASACTLWGPGLWLRRGLPFLCAIAFACVAKGVLPKRRARPAPFARCVREADFLARVTTRQPLRAYLAAAGKLFR